MDSITPLIVGLHGYQRSGKDTAAAGLTDRGFLRVSFAEPLREAIYNLNPRVVAYTADNELSIAPSQRYQKIIDTYGYEAAKDHPIWGAEVRNLLQRFGTECARETFWDSFWIDLADRTIRESNAGAVVITDVRFENEAQYVRDMGGVLVNVTRPGCGPLGNHTSERPIVCDVAVNNDSTIDDLHRRVNRAISDAVSGTIHSPLKKVVTTS